MTKIMQAHRGLELLGVPIHGCLLKDGLIYVDFKDEATESQRQQASQVVAIIDQKTTVDDIRIAKYAADTSAGFTDNGKTYSLAAESLDNWQKLATTLRAEIDAGITEEDDSVALFTVAGEVVELEVKDALKLLAKIGKTARSLQTVDYQWQGAIAAATTVQQLAAIKAAIESA